MNRLFLPAAALLISSSAHAFTGEVALSNPLTHSCSDIENFLLTAKTGSSRAISTGITATRRFSLSNGLLQHDAHFQTIDERQARFQSALGRVEMNFRDSYKYNIAAYRLAKLLGLNMVPPYVERSISNATGSLSWWIDNTIMESQRYRAATPIPDLDSWNKQMYAVRVFHELVYDTDPNLTNLLITPDWQLWIIDLTRAFRTNDTLRDPADLVKIDRRLLERLRSIDAGELQRSLSAVLSKSEIRALDARRRKIVALFDARIHTLGDAEVLYDFPRTAEACGTGL